MPPVIWQSVYYDCMLVCVDRLSGWIIARPSQKDGLTAEKTAHLILDHGWNEVGVPSLITTDQGIQFTGQYWRTICHRLGIRHAYSQAHRPNGNGRAEKAGGQLISVLRKINAEKNINWVEALPLALTKYHDAPGPLGYSPHNIVFGRERNLAGIPYTPNRECEEARDFMDQRAEIDRLLSDQLNEAHQNQADYYNSRRRDRRTFTVGEKVWLIRPKKVGGNKIKSWWTGPFPIVKQLGKDVYALQTSPNETTDAHSDQIKKFLDDEVWTTGIPMVYSHRDPRDKPPMEVDRIRDRRQVGDSWEFLVHWKGAPNAADTWEPTVSFLHLNSPVWQQYCKDEGLFTDIHDLPVYTPALPIFKPMDIIDKTNEATDPLSE